MNMNKIHYRKINAVRDGAVSSWWKEAGESVADRFRGQITLKGLGGALAFLVGRLVFGVRIVVAVALLWLRGLLLLVTHGVAGLALAAFFVMMVIRAVGAGSFDGVFSQFWPLLALSFGMFAVGFIYDLIVLAIAPADIALFQ